MKGYDSATASRSIAAGASRTGASGARLGLWLAGLGVLIYSFTLPSTVLALDGLDPYLVGVGRSAVAAVLAAAALLTVRARPPRRAQWTSYAIVVGGVVIGFPVLTTLALEHGASAAHSAVVIGLLPAATAVFAVLRGGERPSRAFWLASTAGAICVTGFALVRGAGHVTPADLLLLAALLAAAAGYTEGGRLTRDVPGWRVISWALVLGAPGTVPVTAWLLATTDPQWTAGAALGFGYVAAFSAYLGFFAWYEGLARAGIARGGQVQLVQPVLTLLWSGLFLGEVIDATTVLAAVAVLVCVALTQRTRVGGGAHVRGRTRVRPDAAGPPRTMRLRDSVVLDDLGEERDDADADADRDRGLGGGGADAGGDQGHQDDQQGPGGEQRAGTGGAGPLR